MGWIICIAMLIVGCTKGNEVLVAVSGLYAIAGSIGGAAGIIKNALESKNDKGESTNV